MMTARRRGRSAPSASGASSSGSSTSTTARTGAVLVDNLEWTAPMSVLEFLRDVGQHFSINAMLGKESVSARLAAGGLTFTEFSYMLLQSYDYLELHRRYGCRLQIGGNDQWGNITAGPRPHPAGRGRRPLGARADPAAGHRRVRRQDRQEHRRRQRLARPGDDLAVRAVPVPAQRRRPRRRHLPAPAHLPARASRSRSWTPRPPSGRRRGPRSGRSPSSSRRWCTGDDELAPGAGGERGAVRRRARSRTSTSRRSRPRWRRRRRRRVDGSGALRSSTCWRSRLGLSKSDARRAVREGGAYLNNRKVTDEAAVPRGRRLAARALPRAAARPQGDGRGGARPGGEARVARATRRRV